MPFEGRSCHRLREGGTATNQIIAWWANSCLHLVRGTASETRWAQEKGIAHAFSGLVFGSHLDRRSRRSAGLAPANSAPEGRRAPATWLPLAQAHPAHPHRPRLGIRLQRRTHLPASHQGHDSAAGPDHSPRQRRSHKQSADGTTTRLTTQLPFLKGTAQNPSPRHLCRGPGRRSMPG